MRKVGEAREMTINNRMNKESRIYYKAYATLLSTNITIKKINHYFILFLDTVRFDSTSVFAGPVVLSITLNLS